MRYFVAISFLMLLAFSFFPVWAAVSEHEDFWQTGFVISDFPAPFIDNGEADVLIISGQATRESAEIIAAELQRYTTDQVPIIYDSSYSEDLLGLHNLIIVGGPKENSVTRDTQDLPFPFQQTSEGETFIHWKFRPVTDPSTGLLQSEVPSQELEKVAFFVAGLAASGTVNAAQALVSRFSEMRGGIALISREHIEVVLNPLVEPGPFMFIDFPIFYTFENGILDLSEHYPSPSLSVEPPLAVVVTNFWLGGGLGSGGSGLVEVYDALPIHLKEGVSLDSVVGDSLKITITHRGTVNSFDLAPGQAFELSSFDQGAKESEVQPYIAVYTADVSIEYLGTATQIILSDRIQDYGVSIPVIVVDTVQEGYYVKPLPYYLQ